MNRTGSCLCGAVKYTAEVDPKVTACHCGMCRRWTGGPLFAVHTKELEFESTDELRTYASSAWAERGFCAQCGSGLFYRVTAEGKHHGVTSVAYGTLDDPSGFDLHLEWFIDRKPDTYVLEGERERRTEAEVMAMFGG